MVKQSIKTCICGQALNLPEGEVKYFCRCGAAWELGEEGYWFTQSIIVPKRAKPASVLTRNKKYASYTKSKRKRKKGKRC